MLFRSKIDSDELQIRFTMTAHEITALARLETAWFTYTNDHGSTTRIRVMSVVEVATQGDPGKVIDVSREGVVVACGDAAVRLVTVQPAGKSPMPAGAWANGARLPASLA